MDNELKPLNGLLFMGRVVGRVVGAVDGCACWMMLVCRRHMALLITPRPEAVW